MRRMIGTVTAFILAAAFVYVAAYVVIFDVLGVPARNQAGWLGPTLRFLQTGPVIERGDANVYMGDTGPYKVYKPLNTVWLKTQTLPDIPAAGADDEASGAGGGEGRRGRRGGEGRMGGERRGRPDSAAASDDGTTAPAEGERRRGRRGAAADGDTTETADSAEMTTGSERTTRGGEGRRRRGPRTEE